MITSFMRLLVLLFLSIVISSGVYAETIEVEPGTDTLQTAIDAASNGDTLQLSEGTYKGDINFSGKSITIKGLGIQSIIRGTGNLAAVIFNSNEGFSSLLDQVAITGGKRAGAVLINGASPRINRSWIISNKAIGAGSGVYVYAKDDDGNSPSFFNNIIVTNKTKLPKLGNNAYSIYIEDSSPSFINNTIAFNQNSAVLITGNSSPRFTNNIIGFSGKKKSRAIKFSGYNLSSSPQFDYNLFYKNKFDVEVSGAKYKTFDDFIDAGVLTSATFNGNVLGNPKFMKAKRLDLRLKEGSAAIDAGNPDDIYNDLLDNSRNDIGASGGIFINPNL